MSNRSMNLYVRTPKRRTRGETHRPSVATTLLLLMLMGGVLLIALAKVYLEQRTLTAGQQWEASNKELNETLKERDNLLMKREHLTSGDYILPQARRMGLRPPLPGQIRRVWPTGDAVDDAFVATHGQ